MAGDAARLRIVVLAEFEVARLRGGWSGGFGVRKFKRSPRRPASPRRGGARQGMQARAQRGCRSRLPPAGMVRGRSARGRLQRGGRRPPFAAACSSACNCRPVRRRPSRAAPACRRRWRRALPSGRPTPGSSQGKGAQRAGLELGLVALVKWGRWWFVSRGGGSLLGGSRGRKPSYKPCVRVAVFTVQTDDGTRGRRQPSDRTNEQHQQDSIST